MKDGGAAFPILDTTHAADINSLACVDGGMTLRDYFAGQVLSALALEHILWFEKGYLAIKKRLKRQKKRIIVALWIWERVKCGKKMKALLNKALVVDKEISMLEQGIRNYYGKKPPEDYMRPLSSRCYRIADAMLAEGGKEVKNG